MKDLEFRFEDWTLCPARRLLARAGQPVAVEPRVFDLLACLVRHHDRVVSKDELLDEVWPDEPVSIGVIARAVMKARRALGDDEREGQLVRTVPRVGYRFVAPVSVVAATGPSRRASAQEPSVALLPFENRTGRPEFDWVELGLLTVTVKALAGDPRLVVAPVSSVLMALNSVPAATDGATRAQTLRSMLAVQRVVQCSVRADERDFAVDVTVHGEAGPTRHRLAGSDLPGLGRSAANLLEQLLLDERARPLPAAYPVADPFAARALMRGLQKAAEQRWREAANLFRVVLDAEPQAREVELEYLRALAPMGDDRAIAVGDRLLAEALATADFPRAAEIRQALGRTWLNRGLLEPAREQLDAALRLMADAEPSESQTLTLLLRSTIAILQIDFGIAHELLLKAQECCEVHGNLHLGLWAQVSLASIRARMGDLQGGYEAIGAALRRCDGERLRRDLASTIELQGRLALQLGRLDEAAGCAATALRSADEMNALGTVTLAAESLCLIGRLTGRTDGGAEAVATLARRGPAGQPAADSAAAMARAHQAWAEGRLADAMLTMQEAVTQHEQAQAWLHVHNTAPWLVALCLDAGEPVRAEQEMERIASFPRAGQDAELQGALAWLRARLAAGRGAAGAAQELLRDGIARAPAGLWRALMGLDLAQSLFDAGQGDAAARVLQPMGPWLQALPSALRLAGELGMAMHTTRLR
jgi:DNA-binding winged helix-turn-helix (wHTH) protein/tetratricopeptide (TPR) repeat protein